MDCKRKKRDFCRLWITRISAATRSEGRGRLSGSYGEADELERRAAAEAGLPDRGGFVPTGDELFIIDSNLLKVLSWILRRGRLKTIQEKKCSGRWR